MNTVFILLSVQAILGAFDNLWHHELEAKLPQRISARYELSLHAAREAIYSVVFIGLAWFEWRGAWAAVFATLLGAELCITLADFLEEDRTRRLPPFERVLHTLLAVCYGLFLGFLFPVLWAWAQLPSDLFGVSHGWVSCLCTLYGLGVLAWSVRNALAVRQLRRLAGGAAFCAPPCPKCAQSLAPAVLVTGATGFLGSALVADLLQDGQRVIVLSRDARQAQASFGADVWVVESLAAIPSETRIDAVVHLAGARVLSMPWTARRRKALMASRADVTAGLVALMRRMQQAPRVLVSASAVGFYGASQGSGPGGLFPPLDEDACARPGEFQSDLCAAIEHEARRAESLGVRVVRMRFGVVLGCEGGAYPMLAQSARLGLGSVLGNGLQPAPWLHVADAVGLMRFAIKTNCLCGAVNALAPETPTQDQFARALAASFGRRVWLRTPAAPLRAALGEMSTLLLDGQNAQPRAAMAAGFTFTQPELAGALAALAQEARPPRFRGVATTA